MSDKNIDMRYISTFDLIELIVSKSDRDALNELLANRRLFPFNKRHLLLSEFLWLLKEGLYKKHSSKSDVDDLVDFAYDLTLKKYSNLPSLNIIDKNRDPYQKMELRQVDCRYYYGAVVSILNKWKAKTPDYSTLDEEQEISHILLNRVKAHFYKSEQEYMRQRRPFSICYNWKRCGKYYKLWYPVGLGIKAFKAWIEREVPDEVEDIQAERTRLQLRIDAQFFSKREYPIGDHNIVSPNPGCTKESGSDKVSELASSVALEKIEHFDKLRPAIRKLGKPSLKQLIIRIFKDLSDEVYEDQRIAGDFGLSKATFSRFAGSQWKDKSKNSKESSIPDLWHNTARVLGSNQTWLEIAEEAGVMRSVKNAVKKNNSEA